MEQFNAPTQPTANYIGNFGEFTTPKDQFPTSYFSYDLMDVAPSNPNALYQEIDHGNDDNWDKDQTIEYVIPTRAALFQLMQDIMQEIIRETTSHDGSIFTPGDDATSDISNAIDTLWDLKEFDIL